MKHIIVDTSKMQKERGWRDDPFEPEEGSTILIDRFTKKRIHAGTKKANIDQVYHGPWHKHSQTALFEAVKQAISSMRVKVISEIYQDVTQNYGSVDVRSVYRYVGDLVEDGFAVRIELSRNHGVYVKSGSPLLKNKAWLLAQMEGDTETESILSEFE
jgi:hypothetical protein